MKPEIRDLFEHTENVDGVVVAGLHLLLVDKIKTAASRGNGQDKKIRNDLGDIFFCLGEMHKRKAAFVPDRLKDTLTPEVWKAFWDRAKESETSPGDTETYQDWLRDFAGLY